MAAAHGEASPGAPQADHTPAVSAGFGAASISESDLLALLGDLGVASDGVDEDQEAALAPEPEMAEAGAAAGVYSAARIAEQLQAGPGLAAMLAGSVPSAASDWELPGIAGSFRRLASWAQAGELAAVAEIASRAAAANSRIGTCDDGRPNCVPPEAAAQVALAMQMSQPGASPRDRDARAAQDRLRAAGRER
jgi:hypothetical protein